MAYNKDWAPVEVEFLKQNYGKLPPKKLAIALNRSRDCVYKRAAKLGLNADTRSNKQWTTEELFWLEEHWGLRSLNYISKKLNRTPEAVEYMAYLQKLGPSRYAQGYYTARQLAEILGVSHWSVLQWIKHKNLPAAKRATRKQKVYQIDPAKFEEWAREQDMPLLKKCLKVG